MSRRYLQAALVALIGMPVTGAATFHFIAPGDPGAPPGDPNLIIEIWDVGIDMEPPDFWVSTFLRANINEEATGIASFSPIRPGLTAPENPVEQVEALSNFLTSAKQFPNNFDFEGPSTILSDVTSEQPDLMEAFWTSNDPEDGAGPSFVLFRVALTRRASDPGFTLDPTDTLIATITGESTTFEGSGVEPFSFDIYQLPEPGTVVILTLLALFTRRPRTSAKG